MKQFFFSIFLVFLPFQSSNACQCLVHDLLEHFDEADYVFIGTVINSRDSCDLKYSDIKGAFHCTGGPVVSLIKVDNIIKTPVFRCNERKEHEKFIVQSGSNCDVPFLAGENYIVFAKGGLVLTTSRCAGTTEVSNETTESINKLLKLVELRKEIGTESREKKRELFCNSSNQ